MIEHKTTVRVPDMSTVHVKEGYENPCDTCPNWGEPCETCDVSVPLVADRWRDKEITYRQMTICGIPAGEPYVVET